jgi:hypothetical protein
VRKVRVVEEDVVFNQEGRIQYERHAEIPGFIKDNLGVTIRMRLSIAAPGLSEKQRRWYFGSIVTVFMDLCGYEADSEGKDECHRDLKFRWAPRHTRVNRMTNELDEYIPSLRDFSMEEMTDYLDRLLRELAELGRPVPDPRPGWAEARKR